MRRRRRRKGKEADRRADSAGRFDKEKLRLHLFYYRIESINSSLEKKIDTFFLISLKISHLTTYLSPLTSSNPNAST